CFHAASPPYPRPRKKTVKAESISASTGASIKLKASPRDGTSGTSYLRDCSHQCQEEAPQLRRSKSLSIQRTPSREAARRGRLIEFTDFCCAPTATRLKNN